MTDDDRDRDAALRRALAEANALRALLAAHGAGAPAPAAHPGDEDLLARILSTVPSGEVDDGSGPTPADPADPAAGVPAIPAELPATPAADLPAVPAADVPAAPVVPLRAPRRRARRWVAAAAGVAAAAVGGTVLALLPVHDPPAAVASGSPPMLAYPVTPEELAAGGGAPAHDTLLELADAAAERRDPAPAGDVQHVLAQAWYLSSVVDGEGGTTSTVDPVVRETWLSPDGSLVAMEWRGQHLGEDGLLEAVDTTPAEASVDRIPAGSFDPERYTAMSDDPATLRGELLEAAGGAAIGCGPDTTYAAWCLYQAAAIVSDPYVLPASFESALWRVLADEPGVTLAGDVTDRTGRRAVALGVPGGPAGPDVVQVLLVDAGTGRMSGHEEVTLRSEAAGIDEPTVTQFRYVVGADRVAEAGGGDPAADGPAAGAAPSGLQLDQDGRDLVGQLARQVAQRSDAGGEAVAGGAVDGGAPAGGLLGRGAPGEQPRHGAGQHVTAA